MLLRYAVKLLQLLFFYLLLFGVCRIIFLLYFFSEIKESGPGQLPLSLWNALPLDISAAAYLLFIPLIILLFEPLDKKHRVLSALRIYLIVTSFIIILLSVSEIGVYREMHVKLYFHLLSHLWPPDELFHTVSYGLIATLLFISVVLFVLFYRFSLVLTTPQHHSNHHSTHWWKRFLFFAACVGLLIAGSRGGIQPIPINEGEVYFSDNQCVNDATVNPLWNIIHSYIENQLVLSGDSYRVMPQEDADPIVSGLFHTPSDSFIPLFKTARPNICILILESWSASVVGSLGGFEGLTPGFDSLAANGYLFTNFRPAGHVSDQGIPAILSGYPALPIGSAINQPERQVHLPCINNELADAGYYSSFFFGGQLIYGNIKAYIYRNRFSRVVEQKDLPSSLPSGRLGINDSVMLAVWLDSLNQMPRPFFSNLFTLSSHSPFDIPSPYTIDWGGYYMPYLNGIRYSDRQLQVFFEKARKQPWYDETIFLLVADHSHGTPKNYDYSSPEMYHIPLLITGGALKDEFRGRKNNALGSQTDIAATLLKQLHLPVHPYRWSKNLMNPSANKFAFYTFNEGFGFLESERQVVWNKKFPYLNRNITTGKAEDDSLYRKGAAMLQTLMKDFLGH